MTQDPDAPNNARLLSMQKWYRSIEQDGQICVSEGYPTIQLTKERKGDHGFESSTNADKGKFARTKAGVKCSCKKFGYKTSCRESDSTTVAGRYLLPR